MTTTTLNLEEKAMRLEILETLSAIVPSRKCVELRIQNNKGFWMSGFYDADHYERLATDAVAVERTFKPKGSYLTLNAVNPDLLARRQNRFDTYAKRGTLAGDKDIANWDYLPVDIDPVRPTGISSTKEELALSEAKTDEVVAYLTEQGFPLPLRACSGNGVHLLYRINLPRSPENDVVVQTILTHLDEKFSTDKVGVDTVNNNPSRIFKLYGTWARKGDSTEERPHRKSRMTFVPDPFLVVEESVLLGICRAHPLPASSGKKKGSKLKNPKDVKSRHPELLIAVGKMVNGNFPDESIQKRCEELNAGFKEPKPIDVLTKEVADLIKFCKERQAEIDKKPPYIVPVIDEETGEISGYRIDYILYSNFLHGEFGTVFFNEQIYIYDKEKHVYRPAANEIQTHIRDTIIEHEIPTTLTRTTPEILLHLKAMGGFTEYPFNFSSDTLPVKNGIIKIHRDRVKIENGLVNLKSCVNLLPHGKEHLFTFVLDANYDPTVDTAGIFDLFKAWVATDKDVVKLLQAPAQGLVQMQTRHSHKKAYLIQGETNSGKTSYFKLLIRFFTPEYISSASLQDLCEDKFVGSELEGKIINIKDDLQALPLKTCEQFKEITGDCSIGVERKYEVKYRGWATATLMFSCNYPPRCNEQVKKDGAYWARFEYIKFPNTFPTNHKFYEETYTPEFLSAFLNALLNAVVQIHNKGELLEVSEPGEVLMNWSADADPIQNFIEDTFGDSQEPHDYSKIKMFAEYQRWYKETVGDMRRMITSEKAFTSAIQPYFVVADKRLEKDASGKREHVRVYRANRIQLNAKLNLVPVSEQESLKT